MEGTREALAEAHRITPWWQRRGLAVLGHHRLLLVTALRPSFAPPFTVAALAGPSAGAAPPALLPAVRAYARSLLAAYPPNQT